MSFDKADVRALDRELPQGFVVRAPRANKAASDESRSEIAAELREQGHIPSFRTSFQANGGNNATARLYRKVNGDVMQAKPFNMSVVGYVDKERSGKGYIIATLYLGQNPQASVYFKQLYRKACQMLGEDSQMWLCDQYITVKDGEEQKRWNGEDGEPDKINVLISYKGSAVADHEEGKTSILNIKGLVPWGLSLRKTDKGMHYGIKFGAETISQENPAPQPKQKASSKRQKTDQ